jgi:hypothetical protein
MSLRDAADLLDQTQRLLTDARALLDSGETRYPSGGITGILGLYEALCRALDRVEGERLRELLAGVAEQVERLAALDGDIERIRRLRAGMAAH